MSLVGGCSLHFDSRRLAILAALHYAILWYRSSITYEYTLLLNRGILPFYYRMLPWVHNLPKLDISELNGSFHFLFHYPNIALLCTL